MGIDAPSTDLTARIRGQRAALKRAGAIDPVTQRVNHEVPVDLAVVENVARAQAARAARAPDTRIVDFEYTDEEREALGLEAEGAAEVGTEEQGVPLPDEVIAEQPDHGFDLGETPDRELTEQELADAAHVVDSWQADAVQNAILERVEELHERMDGQDKALLLIAQAITANSKDHESLGAIILELTRAVLREPVPEPGIFARFRRWLRTAR